MAEVEATLQRLTSHRSVKGVLVLSNETGRVIRWTGQILEGPTTGSKASSAVEDGDNEEATESSKGVRSAEISEPAKRYAALVRRIVGSAKDEVVNVDKEVCSKLKVQTCFLTVS